MNALYDDARQRMMKATFNWVTTDMVLTLWGGEPDYLQADRMLSDITARGGVLIGHSITITQKTVSADGTGQTNTVIVPSVPIGNDVTWMTLAKRGATDLASELIYFIDEAVELPFVPNGLDMVINPDWAYQRGWFRP